jgi:transposase
MRATKQYREWLPDQPYLFPPSPHDWLDEGDLAYFILDVVRVLDLDAIEAVIASKDARGTRPYHPRMMAALLLYGYCIGVMSSRKIETATYRDVAFRVIAGGNHPDHTRISAFRREHLRALEGLFIQTVLLAQRAGLVKLGRVGLDGTKIQANASKHKAMSYERMLKVEEELREEIEQLLLLAEQTDRHEDATYGKDKRGDELPEELRRREGRLAKLQRAKVELEAEAARTRAEQLRQRAETQRRHAQTAEDPVERKRAATRANKALEQADALCAGGEPQMPQGSGNPVAELPHHRVPSTPEGKPRPEAQRNFTDPDSRIMKRDGTYIQGYNGQAAVDGQHQIIVSCALTNQPPDQQHLPPLVEQIRNNCGAYPDKLLADAGYWDERHVRFCGERGIDPYIATGRLHHDRTSVPIRGRPPKNLDAKGLMTRKLRTKHGRAEYARRKVIPEPVFGQIRIGQGFQHFLLRGIDKAQAEWSLVCACHNLLKVYRLAGASVTA